MICACCGQPTPAAPCEACGGEPTVDGRYQLLERLGRVGAGRTWRALREADGRPVALSCVQAPEGVEPEAAMRFRAGVALAERLRHRDLPRLVEGFETLLGGLPCLCTVQEWVEGVSLDRDLHPHDEDEALEVLEAILPALAYVHGLSPPLVHGDVCLANLLRRPDGGLSLVGFGAQVAARALRHQPRAGWPYTAPEWSPPEADPAVDLYSLGVVLLALLLGREPAGPGVRWQRQVQVGPLTGLLLEQLLQPDPALRQRSLTQTLALVRGARAGGRAQEDLERLAWDNAGVLPEAGTPPPSQQRVAAPVLLDPAQPTTDELLRPHRIRRRGRWIALVLLLTVGALLLWLAL